MNKNKGVKVTGAEGEELDLIVVGGASGGDEEAGVAEEEEAAEGNTTLGDTESAEDEEEENLELDWKAARQAIRDADHAVGWSIEDYDKRLAVNTLKKRYNDKERTQSLFDAIMAL